jgi:DNA-binding transcriptional regulator of glucitol operon
MEMMINRLIFVAIFAAIGALAYGWWYNNYRITSAQQEKLAQFVNAGPRFTAFDGKELCEYMNIIAKHSIGFQKSGLPLLDCQKYLRSGDQR